MIQRAIYIINSLPHRIRMLIYRRKKPWIARGKYNLLYWIMPDSALEYQIVKNGVYSDWIATHLKYLISTQGIVLDIGANVGLLSLPFAQAHVPQGKVYAFEPDNTVRHLLEKNISINGITNILVYPYALQDNEVKKSVTFHHRETMDGDWLINKGLSSMEDIKQFTTKTIKVPATTIDAVVEKHKLKRVDFIKIDVEGAEAKVLKGAIKTIKKFKPIVEYEYSTILDQLVRSQNTNESFLLLQQIGYLQFEIVNEQWFRLVRQPENIPASNILCFPRGKVPNIIKQNEKT